MRNKTGAPNGISANAGPTLAFPSETANTCNVKPQFLSLYHIPERRWSASHHHFSQMPLRKLEQAILLLLKYFNSITICLSFLNYLLQNFYEVDFWKNSFKTQI